MNAPHGVTSVSIPVDATSGNTTVVKSATGLSVPVYPAPTVYAVVNSQITAADVGRLSSHHEWIHRREPSHHGPPEATGRQPRYFRAVAHLLKSAATIG
jgi:hypothetical protein